MKRTVLVGSGDAEVRIYPLRRTTCRYRSYQVAWYELGQRQTKTFADPENARLFAQQRHVALANGSKPTDAGLRDIEILRDAETIAGKFNVSLATAIREWADARALLSHVGLFEAVKGYAASIATVEQITIAEAADRCLAEKRDAGLSKRYIGILRSNFEAIKRTFGRSLLSEIKTADIQNFFVRYQAAPRSKNNVLESFSMLMLWGKKRRHYPHDRPLPVEGITRFVQAPLVPEIFTVDEMRKLIRAAGRDVTPYLAIAAFAGLRRAEIERLDWSAVDFKSGLILVSGHIAKTRQRRLVPMCPNLREWLQPFASPQGPVAPRNLQVRLPKCAARAGIEWKPNALRHSYASYRLAIVQDAAKVSLEMGNSPQMLFQHYRELVMPDAATAWFRIVPERAA